MTLNVRKNDGSLVAIDINKIHKHAEFACAGLDGVSQSELETDAHITFYDGMPTSEIQKTLVLTAADKIKNHYNWNYVASRLLLLSLFKDVTGGDLTYPPLRSYVEKASEAGELSKELLTNGFDWEALDAAIRPERDMQFTYLGLSTLTDRYFRRDSAGYYGKRDAVLELPQHFFMRVAMGLTLRGAEKAEEVTARAIEFYEILSTFDFLNSTPTLFNAGTNTPQLSSCYLLSMGDSLPGIMSTAEEAAGYSKLSGGIGIDMSQVRGRDSFIKGTAGRSSGVVPFAKIIESTLSAFNQMGKRKGAGALYLADWHVDIESFLDLKTETGDPRVRTHDLQTALWLSDLFLERKEDPEAMWSLFSPDDVPELNETDGDEFRKVYEEAEAKGLARRQVKARDLWKKMITSTFETGSYYKANKDMINQRRMQKDTGRVRSSNLCCVAADQRVSTNLGMLTVGELYEMQQEVRTVGPNGYNNSSVMYKPRPNAPMAKIHTLEGYTHKVTPDHRVWVKDRGMVEAQHLEEGDLILLQSMEGEFGQVHKPELAFIAGLLASDGTYMSNDAIRLDIWKGKNASEEVLEDVRVSMAKVAGVDVASIGILEASSADKYYVHSAAVGKELAKHGVTRDTKTSIPEFVWKGDRETVSRYLEGLWSGDGTLQASSVGVTTCSLSSTDLSHIEAVQVLLSNLGIKSSVNFMRGSSQRLMPDGRGGERMYDCKPVYRLLMTSIRACKIFEEATGFARKHRSSPQSSTFLENLRKDGYAQKFTATFSHLEELPNEDAYCLEVFHKDHVWCVNGMVSSNSEITLNTEPNVTSAVCNIGSINLANIHDASHLTRVVRTAIRMLDNVVTIGLVPHENGRRFQDQERAIGLGIMGWTEKLAKSGVRFDSEDHLKANALTWKLISRAAIEASADLAAERGSYPLFAQSEWAKGVLPYDTAPQEALDLIPGFDWSFEDDAELREKTKRGMRNSHLMAIAPTATISNIVGTTSCTELPLELVDVKENLSGNFIDRSSVLKYLSEEDAQTAREVNQWWVIAAAAVRQVYIDQAQSTNIFLPHGMQYEDGTKVTGNVMSEWFSFAGRVLKTTYYTRGVSAGSKSRKEQKLVKEVTAEALVCSIDNPEACESCQ